MNTGPATQSAQAGTEQIRWQLRVFLTLTFGWAWLLWGYWVWAMPSGGLQLSPSFLVCALLGGLAPSLAAGATRSIAGGRTAALELLRPLLFWRQPLAIYAIAVCAAPLSALASALVQFWIFGHLRWPDPALLAAASIWPVAAALGEELGWRGLLLPALARRHGILPAAVLVGLIWGLWHLPADYIALKGYGDLFVPAFLLNGPVVLTGHSIIMAWLWRRTQGSLLVAVVYHWATTASAMAMPTAANDAWSGLLSAAIGAATVWVLAGVLWFTHRNEM